jgi:cytochrome b
MALRTLNQPMLLPMRVWDLPIRLFHWGIVLLVIVSYVSSQLDWIPVHVLSGLTMLAALIFRLAWGFIGSDTARFAKFLVSPIAGLRHLSALREPTPDTQLGHNEAGGWMVIVLLLLLAIQVGTGLCARTKHEAVGPFAKYLDEATSTLLSQVHGFNFNLLLVAIVLHVAAVAVYRRIKGHDLLSPMITGKKRLPAATRAPRLASPVLAAVVLAVAGVISWLIATQI